MYEKLMQGISSFYGMVPMSMAELLSFSVAAITLFMIIQALGDSISNRKWAQWRKVLRFIVVTGTFGYMFFFLLYGINFTRMPIKDIDVQKIDELSDEVLVEALSYYIDQANEKVAYIETNLVPSPVYEEIFYLADNSYYYLPEEYRYLSGVYGQPKKLILSDLQSKMGYTGMFFPFTGEPLINANLVRVEVPFTTAHEIAHQRGIVKEYEASYISFLACVNSEDVYFNYSGYFAAIQTLRTELWKRDEMLYSETMEKCSPYLLRDIRAVQDFWRVNYDAALGDKMDVVVEANLKSNGEEDGLLSYGHVAGYLLDYYIELEKK
ncbi:MAG: DUF3810 domain-containing protein [Vallitaleaceae bacterium]|nr:DUF3810 domain-containing protein [Vallitaleaceae bacterium]